MDLLKALGSLPMALLLAGTAAAERWIVPAGAHVSGSAGTDWRTDLRLVNPTDAEVVVTVVLLEADRDNTALDRSMTYVVPANGKVAVADVFRGAFDFEGTGGLLIECADSRLVATTRTYNLVLDGSTYGQFIPAVAESDALAAGNDGHLINLAKSSAFRSNVGYTAASRDGGRVTVDLYDDRGSLLGTTERSFSGFEHHQFNDVFSVVGAPAAAVARAVVRATAPIVPYASVVDRRTGDPVAIMFQLLAESSSEIAVPAAARVAGAQGSVWRTDLRVFNPGPATVTLSIAYHQKGTPGAGRPSTDMSVGGGEILAIDDFMLNGLGFQQANGALRISADRPVLAWSRTYNQGDGGTFGQSISGVPVTAIEASGWERTFTGLSNTGFRSNVGFFNLSDREAQLELALRDENGNLAGEGTVDLGPGVMDQINDVFDDLGVGGAVGDGYWLAVSGFEAVIPYLSVSDNISSDPVFETGVGAAGPCEIGLTATADAFVRGGDFADATFGNYGVLLIKGISGGTYARKSYLVFDIGSDVVPDAFSSVGLRLTASRHVSTIPRDAVVSGIIDNDDWNPDSLAETQITWNNAPRNDPASGVAFLDQGTTSSAGVRRLATVNLDNSDPPDTAYLIDVTDFVRWAVGDNPGFSDRSPSGDADGRVTLVIAHSEELSGYDGTEFYSRENQAHEGCFRPQLIFQP